MQAKEKIYSNFYFFLPKMKGDLERHISQQIMCDLRHDVGTPSILCKLYTIPDQSPDHLIFLLYILYVQCSIRFMQ